jgi:hypothetical protein
MKTPATLLFSLLLFFSACMSSKRYEVESDYSYHGKFKKYKTFNFVKDVNPDAESNQQNTIIEDEIKFRMEVMGYQMTERRPDILISYRIFLDDVRFTGFNQPKIEDWIKVQNEDVSYDPVKYNLREGTLLILFFDGKQQRTIWQGYASGLFGNSLFNSERYLKKPVRLIFDKYRFMAEGFAYENQQ